MGRYWRDNKYGHEAGYIALNESESLWFCLKWLAVAVGVVAASGLVIYGLLTLLA